MVNNSMCVKRVAWMFCVVLIADVAAQEQCTDLRGRLISHGLHYVPGPDTCTLCVCDNGLPKVCKAVLCSPPQDCRSFRVGTTCCEFICLDDVVKPAEGAEANVRVAAGGAAAIVLLTVALVVYRVRKQKRRRPPHADDQRSLTSIGYISGSMGYMGGACEPALAAWKPAAHYLPRGEAPPPYDEAVAQTRQENARMANEMSYHRTYPATVETLARPDDSVQCTGHGYVNIPRPVTQIANTQNCYNAPLLQPVHQAESREPASMPHHPLAHNMVGFPSAIRLTGSLGAISNRGLLSVLQREPEHERPHNVPGFYTNAASAHTSLHRTIPRLAGASLLDAPLAGAGLRRAERALCDVRRSFHRAPEPRALPAAGRSVPRHLDLAAARPLDTLLTSGSARLGGSGGSEASSGGNVGSSGNGIGGGSGNGIGGGSGNGIGGGSGNGIGGGSGNGIGGGSGNGIGGGSSGGNGGGSGSWRARVHSEDLDAPPPPAPATLPLTVDKPSCVCSYEGTTAPGAEDADDYRSECENCKSASSSRWVLEEGWEAEGGDGTQTLQRRAPPPAQPPPATATLPQPVTKQARSVMGPPSNWENWFNTIPDSDSESEEE